MSSTTWTPCALRSEARRLERRAWRAVEAQHRASTMRLADGLAEQQLLEDLLEAGKPPLPAAARRLHYLLATPFRYPSPFGSRFRAPTDPGVWYGADAPRTALAELAFWRWRFLLDAPALTALAPTPHTLFRARLRTRAVDLMRPPLAAQRAQWESPIAYAATQALARAAREAPLGAIRYRSVRDPRRGACVALLTPEAFAAPAPDETQGWHLSVTGERVAAVRAVGSEAFEFASADWPRERPG
ncbi:MAG TPA: RES family NAD+ phosphorylase [Mizugakiibacter sp.]